VTGSLRAEDGEIVNLVADGVTVGNLNTLSLSTEELITERITAAEGVITNLTNTTLSSSTINASTINTTTISINGSEPLLELPNVFIVCSAGGSKYTTIQSAIDAAVAGGFDDNNPATVQICPGQYTENLTLYSGINVTGSNPGSVFIVSNGTPHTYGGTGTIVIENLTFFDPIGSANMLESTAGGELRIIDVVMFNTAGSSNYLIEAQGAMGEGRLFIERTWLVNFQFGNPMPSAGPVLHTTGGSFELYSNRIFGGQLVVVTGLDDRSAVERCHCELVNTDAFHIVAGVQNNRVIQLTHNAFLTGTPNSDFMRLDGGTVLLNQNYIVYPGTGRIAYSSGSSTGASLRQGNNYYGLQVGMGGGNSTSTIDTANGMNYATTEYLTPIVQGSLNYQIEPQSKDRLFVITGLGGANTVFLPVAASQPGVKLTIKNNTGANISVSPIAGGTIDSGGAAVTVVAGDGRAFIGTTSSDWTSV
jgi:hypothetical protein